MKKKIKNIFFKNFFNLSINQLINILFTLIITPILFQKIEVESFGISKSIFHCSYGYFSNGWLWVQY
jgi:hypothetical protein